nr:acid-sensing ion channel 4-A-like [Parasteatoda tepidariorum]
MMSKDIEIKRRKNKVRKGGKNQIAAALKCIGFILCVTGFSYQVSEFMVRFYSHPTVLNIDINETPKFVRPALTFCNLNPFRRSTYCNENLVNCEKPENIQQFCSDKPHYCRQKKNMSDFRVG